jgi:hypothetical protein
LSDRILIARQGKIIDEHRRGNPTEDHVRRGSLVVQTITLSPQWATEEIFPQTVECARPLSPSL